MERESSSFMQGLRTVARRFRYRHDDVSPQGKTAMSITEKWLDLARDAQGFTSDYQLAKALGVSTQRLSNYRGVARGRMGDEVAVKIAKLAGVPAARILGELNAEKTKSPDARAVWLRIAQYAAGVVIVSTLLIGGIQPAQASEAGSSAPTLNIM